MPYYQERQNEKVGKLYSKFPYPSFQVSQFFLDYYSKFPYPFFPSFSVFSGLLLKISISLLSKFLSFCGLLRSRKVWEWWHQTSPPSFLIHISLAPDQLLEKLSKIILCFAAIKMTLFLVTRGLFDRQKPQKISDLLFPSENCCVYCSGIIHSRTTSYYFLNGGIHLVSLYKLMHNLNAMDKLRFRMQQNRQ
jgi:hypothetical protein